MTFGTLMGQVQFDMFYVFRKVFFSNLLSKVYANNTNLKWEEMQMKLKKIYINQKPTKKTNKNRSLKIKLHKCSITNE